VDVHGIRSQLGYAWRTSPRINPGATLSHWRSPPMVDGLWSEVRSRSMFIPCLDDCTTNGAGVRSCASVNGHGREPFKRCVPENLLGRFASYDILLHVYLPRVPR
jgi:hypothetical protein